MTIMCLRYYTIGKFGENHERSFSPCNIETWFRYELTHHILDILPHNVLYIFILIIYRNLTWFHNIFTPKCAKNILTSFPCSWICHFCLTNISCARACNLFFLGEAHLRSTAWQWPSCNIPTANESRASNGQLILKLHHLYCHKFTTYIVSIIRCW